MLDLNDGERAYMQDMRMPSTDTNGNEVMVGLTLEETLRMLEHSRRFLTGDRDRSESGQADYMSLQRKHEFARRQVLGAENELRNLQGNTH